MSQVSFRTKYDGHNVEVVGGWDSPLNGYHLAIFNRDVPENDEGVLWSNLNSPSAFIAFPKSTELFRKQLASIGIESPPAFWEICELREGNVFYSFNPETRLWDKA
jgi:hypothetical protein